jgi:hypothetical protein
MGPWLDRVLTIGHHAHGEMSSTEAIVEAENEIANDGPVVVTKAGKRSPKALKEDAEKQAKEKRKGEENERCARSLIYRSLRVNVGP